MDYQDILQGAKDNMGPCKACPVCNGMACRNHIPGPGAKGVGDVAIRNYQKWQEIRVNMDTICENLSVDASFELFGEKYRYPIFAAPVGAMKMHYGDKYDDMEYNQILVSACRDAGIAAFTGDGLNAEVVRSAAKAIGANGGRGIPTIKPWHRQMVFEKIDLVKAAGAKAIAMDIDAAGLPFLKNMDPPAGSKSVEEMREIITYAGLPFIVKGIMTVRGAVKAMEAGASGIVVSNHGGRVLDQTPATAEVLAEIALAVKGKMKIFVDGGLRSGVDIFKALALGADAVLVGRPYVTAVYGGGAEGVKVFTEKLGAELMDTMAMCGVHKLSGIDRTMIHGDGNMSPKSRI